MILSPQVIDAISKHALQSFPNESCGLIVDGVYVPCVNAAENPATDFKIRAEDQIAARAGGKELQMVVHSHPNGPFFPSMLDMIGQKNTRVPWAIVATDGERVSPPEIWGDQVEIPPVIGRQFMHGIRDCYSLVRDTYRLGKDKLAEQGVAWSLAPLELYDVPRDDEWWGREKAPGLDLYQDHMMPQGFVKIPREQARPGDGFLIKIRSERLNHAGLLLPNNLILHHLPNRISRREPAGLWAHSAEIWVRNERAVDA